MAHHSFYVRNVFLAFVHKITKLEQTDTEVKIYMSYIGKIGYYFRKFDNMHILSDMLRKDDDFIPVIFIRLLLGTFFYEQA